MSSRHVVIPLVIVVLFELSLALIAQSCSFQKSDRQIALDKGEIYTGLLKDNPCDCVAKKVRDIPGTSIQEISVLKRDKLAYYSIVSGLASKYDSIKMGDSVYLVYAEYIKQGLLGMRSESEATERPGEEMYSLLVRKK
jgi:hypothetical protein